MNRRAHEQTFAIRRPDGGNVTIWTLGMTLVVAVLGWLSIGLWSAFAERRELANAADQAAQAGATALDLAVLRTTGEHVLAPGLAEERALDTLAAHDLGEITAVDVDATSGRITVIVEADVDLGLLSLLDDEPFHVRVTAIGRPKEPAP